MRKVLLAMALAGLAYIPGEAAINPRGIVNAGSFAPQGLPNAQIAQGSIFTIFGTELSEAGVHRASEFPLPNELGGTSIQVTVNGTTVNVLPLVATPNQVNALLPSSTPVGSGTLTLQAGGQSFMEPIEVTAHSPGIFALNQAGSGPGVLYNFIAEGNQPVNGLDQAANPSQIVTLWLTGLGPISGDDAAQPTPTDLQDTFDIEIYVGGQEVQQILYAGRSQCCAGLDQVNFRVPANVEGCYAPLTVVVDGVPSNTVTMSIASDGTLCSDSHFLTEDELTGILTGDTVSIGTINLSSVQTSGLTGDTLTEIATADFSRYTPQSFRQVSFSEAFTPTGSCFVYTAQGQEAEVPDVIPGTNLDAGVIRLTGPDSLDRELEQTETGVYFLNLGPDIPVPGASPTLVAGDYTFSGQGGADVGAFTAARSYSGGITWTNRNSISTVNRGQPLTITWTGGAASDGDSVYIAGFSIAGLNLEDEDDSSAVAAGFICHAPISAGSFTVGPQILSALPPSESFETPIGPFGTGTLQVGNISDPERFTAPGLDIGFSFVSSVTGQAVTYE